MKTESNLNTIFEQDGKVYAICSHNVSAKDLAMLLYGLYSCIWHWFPPLHKFRASLLSIYSGSKAPFLPFFFPRLGVYYSGPATFIASITLDPVPAGPDLAGLVHRLVAADW